MNMRVVAMLLLVIYMSHAQQAGRVQPTGVVLAPDSNARGTCDVRPRSAEDCDARAVAFCGTAGTSAFFVCRSVFNKWCTKPARVTSVAECLRQRCDTLGAAGGHSYDFTVHACRNGRFNKPEIGMAQLCQEQTCTCNCPVPPPCPEGQKRLELPDALVGCNCPSNQCIPDPDFRGTCDVRPREKTSCSERAIRFCGEAGTSSFILCRQVYKQWCLNPARVTSVASCLAERCDTLPAAPGHTQPESVAACRTGFFNRPELGMAKLCAEQTCNCKCDTTQCPVGKSRLVTPTTLQGCACPFCEVCPAPAALAAPCGPGLTAVQVPGPVGTDRCPINKCENCAGSPAPICPFPTISRVTSKDDKGCPVETCVSCAGVKCARPLVCPSGQRAVSKPGECCAHECQKCPNTLETCPKLNCSPKQRVVFPQSHCCPICHDSTAAVENDRMSTTTSAGNPYIGLAIVGGCLAVGGTIATVLILKGLY